jgi:UDP-N-acetyl-D-mannosaminuronate dehydrogenase
MRILIVGDGEIGSAIKSNITKINDVTINTCDPPLGQYADQLIQYQVGHICVPVGNSENVPMEEEFFCNMVYDLVKRFRVQQWIIHSTITLGIVKKLTNFLMIWKEVEMIHIPLRGTHGQLATEIIKDPIYIGIFKPYNLNSLWIKEYLNKIGFKMLNWVSASEAALAKLVSVVWFGLNIAFVQEIFLLCQKEGLDFTKVYTDYAKHDRVGKQYHSITPYPKFIHRPIFYPGVIGGKCVIQDEILLKPYLINPEVIDWCLGNNKRLKESESHDQNCE